LADYLSVLDAQQSYLQAQQSQAQAVEAVANDLVTLYQALGGGWEQNFPAPDVSGPPSPITTVADYAPPAAAPDMTPAGMTPAAAAPSNAGQPAAEPQVTQVTTAPASITLPSPLQR